jgi:hypothetical protein
MKGSLERERVSPTRYMHNSLRYSRKKCPFSYIFRNCPCDRLLSVSLQYEIHVLRPVAHSKLGVRDLSKSPPLVDIAAVATPRLHNVTVRLVSVGQIEALALAFNGDVIVADGGQIPFLSRQVGVALANGKRISISTDMVLYCDNQDSRSRSCP